MDELSGIISDQGANIHAVRHDRAIDDLDIGEAYLVFEVETGGADHAGRVVDAIAGRDYDVAVVNRAPSS